MTIKQKPFIETNASTMTISELGKAIGLSAQAVSSAIKASGLERKRTQATFDEVSTGGKQLRVLDVLRMICEKPMTMTEIAHQIHVDKRTVYRYMALMIDVGADVKMNKSGKYYVTECPFCKKPMA